MVHEAGDNAQNFWSGNGLLLAGRNLEAMIWCLTSVPLVSSWNGQGQDGGLVREKEKRRVASGEVRLSAVYQHAKSECFSAPLATCSAKVPLTQGVKLP